MQSDLIRIEPGGPIPYHYWLGKFPVTQAIYEEITGTNPSHFKGPELPVETVSWYDASKFCEQLGLREQAPPGYEYRLPTEKEWAWAAIGGNESRGYAYAGSNNLDEVGWYRVNSNNTTHPVGHKQPNELGLYDMSGNVGEWCCDYWNDEQTDALLAYRKASIRVYRGGSWINAARLCRSANRSGFTPVITSYYLGFRVALAPKVQDLILMEQV